jgi:hypothetical protein
MIRLLTCLPRATVDWRSQTALDKVQSGPLDTRFSGPLMSSMLPPNDDIGTHQKRQCGETKEMAVILTSEHCCRPAWPLPGLYCGRNKESRQSWAGGITAPPALSNCQQQGSFLTRHHYVSSTQHQHSAVGTNYELSRILASIPASGRLRCWLQYVGTFTRSLALIILARTGTPACILHDPGTPNLLVPAHMGLLLVVW